MKKKRNAVILWKKRSTSNYGKNVMVGSSAITNRLVYLFAELQYPNPSYKNNNDKNR